MIRPPEGSFLELNFYFGDRPEREAFAGLVAALVDLGARFTGNAWAHRGRGIRDRPFKFAFDRARRRIAVGSLEALHRWLGKPDTRVVEVEMIGAAGTADDVAEVVTYQGISREASEIDRHPLAIWTEGWLFDGPIPEEEPAEARRVGLRAYQRFRALVERLRPSYAALTHEYALECPTELRREGISLAFIDFYVSRAYLGAAALRRIGQAFAEAYQESFGDGIYISHNPFFNPENRAAALTDPWGTSARVVEEIVRAHDAAG